MRLPILLATLILSVAAHSAPAADSDQDGLPDSTDACPTVIYTPAFDWNACPPMDLNPGNDADPECKARERVAQLLVSTGAAHMAFSVVAGGRLHFADAFTYVGGGQFAHDPDGVNRLFRVGSTSKSFTAVAAKILEEDGTLSFGDFVSDDDGSQVLGGGVRTLRHLLTHRGCFKLDSGALHLFCYPGDLAAFWAEPDDLVSPHYSGGTYGNLFGGYEYSAFNYSLAGTYLANRAGEDFARILQTRIFDAAGLCTATLDNSRATGTPIGSHSGYATSASMHVGPYINQVSVTDARCEDNFYSSDDLPSDPYIHQDYHLDEAGARARDPAGGVIASVIDMAHFAETLLASYRGTGGLVSQAGVRDLWSRVSDLGCEPNCPYEPYYGIGFFTDSPPGGPILQVGHGGARPGFQSAFVLRPEADLAVSILTDADVGTVALSDLAKTILDDFEPFVGVEPSRSLAKVPRLASLGPIPVTVSGATTIRFALPREAGVRLRVYDVRGRLVRTLADDTYAEGTHGVSWRPAEDGVAPGAYFARLLVDGTAHVRKVIVSQ